MGRFEYCLEDLLNAPLIAAVRGEIAKLNEDCKTANLPDLAKALGFSSVRVESVDPSPVTEGVFNADGHYQGERIGGITSIRLIDEQEKISESADLKRKLARLHHFVAQVALNLHSNASGTDLAESMEELAVLIRPQNTHVVPLYPQQVLSLIKAIVPHTSGEMRVISGEAAEMPNADGRMGEAMVNWVVQGNKVTDLTRFMRGGGSGADSVEVIPKEDPTSPMAVLNQLAVFEKVQAQGPKPIVVEVEGENISTEIIAQIAKEIGIQGPFAFQMVVMEGVTDARAIGQLTVGNITFGQLTDSMAQPQIEAPFVGVGIKTDSPYTQQGHVHGLSINHKKGGHFVKLAGKGKIRIAFSPLNKVVYATYDAKK